MTYNLDALAEFLKLPEPYRCATCPYCNGTRDATVKHRDKKPEPWHWWSQHLGAPKTVVAPMVDQSELPYRMLCRKYGADLAYTPMFHSLNFKNSDTYRAREFATCPEDRPLFVQFCGNDAEVVLAAARFVEGHCDAVDLNLGCPQGIAKKGFYGSFLMERWDVVHTILHTLVVELAVPVTAKMRVFDDLELTLRYARMLRDTGIHVLAVHGRTREMKGQETGMADLDKIAAVKREIRNIPVIANGNILQFGDVPANLARTGCDAVMSAESLLWDPRLFANAPNYVLTGRGFVANKAQRLAGVANATEYMALVRGPYPCPAPYAKSHVFKMVHHSLEVHPHMRDKLGRVTNDAGDRVQLDELLALMLELRAVEEACDVDVYVKRSKEQHAAADATAAAAAADCGLDCAARGGAAAAAASGGDGDGGQPRPSPAVVGFGCRRNLAEPDYASAIEEGGFGNMFGDESM